ncbi:hypothetical protein GSI_08275 [Ganoderma sinense ZZ0214-1]|uniref:J domain-containing protein n=1 Tax=Ganoderma sinense ZZ0214-1 TaxID=1077348 RepID=A0A2G8S7X2_9APHY|nr:hypothetical protein GSI_08275 [Ganoderma sinense ZZ0214-1]
MPPRLPSRLLSLNSRHAACRSPSVAHSRSLVTGLNLPTTYHGKSKPRPFVRAGPSRAFHASTPSLAPKDPYKVLGVKKDATPAEVKKTYFAVCL